MVDGINDAGVAININIVPHQPGTKFNETGDLSSQCVVRYVLDNAGCVEEAITLLGAKTICQSIVKLAGDQTHYMVSQHRLLSSGRSLFCLALCLIPTTKEFMERRWGFGYLIYRFIKKNFPYPYRM